jgi:tRNA-2-methylthio-N6-dimethylallyladenosine synthase
MLENAVKKYYIKTFGCQANEADSNTMAGILEALDFQPFLATAADRMQSVDEANEHEFLLHSLPQCELVIINTCSVRQKSEDKVYGLGKVVKELKDSNQDIPFMVMSGCMVGSVTGERKRYEFDELRKKTPWVDLYINPSQVWDLPNFLAKHNILSDWALQKFDRSQILPKHQPHKTAFVNISQGCDNFCTFCVVPYSRGKEVSRSKVDIVREVRYLALRGVTDVMLCGQNVNSWGLTVGEKFRLRSGSSEKIPFADLLRTVTEIDGIKKVSFISSNPFDFTQDLIETLANPKISNYLHIAVQSGNNDILQKMHRRHTVEEFINLTEKIRKVRDDIEFGTDIIVGFPGETHEQFMDTVKLFEKVPFNVAYIAMYSPRKGTFATKNLIDDVPSHEKKWRSAYLNDFWKKTKPSRKTAYVQNG